MLILETFLATILFSKSLFVRQRGVKHESVMAAHQIIGCILFGILGYYKCTNKKHSDPPLYISMMISSKTYGKWNTFPRFWHRKNTLYTWQKSDTCQCVVVKSISLSLLFGTEMSFSNTFDSFVNSERSAILAWGFLLWVTNLAYFVHSYSFQALQWSE